MSLARKTTASPSPIADLHFRWPWRPYQARVLDAVQKHLRDGRLHLVAAPGSGKTILGLEVFRRLDRPTLVLSPTLTIRNQWIERLQDFCAPHTPFPPAWISTDLEQPAFFTTITYQALLTRHRRDLALEPREEELDAEAAQAPDAEEISDIIACCRKAGFATLILDEAHHLRAEWWKALTRLSEGLEKPVIVALTATPPYEAAGHEWRRYQELCGPIDEEVAVPELVRAGNLCPHQDYVWLIAPLSREQTLLHRHDAAVEALGRELLVEPSFRQAVLQHPWITAEQPDPEQILEAPETAIALLVFLRASGAPLPEQLLAVLALSAAELPPLDRRWWQVLVRGYLFDERWPQQDSIVKGRADLARRLREMGLLWRRELRLAASNPLKNQLTLTPGKIDACLDIYRLERQRRGDDLRLVILTDFIRAASPHPTLGAWPVFRALAGSAPAPEAERMGLLTGRLVLLPERLRPALQRGMGEVRPSEELPGYVQISAAGASLVRLVTELLRQGELQLLVGTRSLLGEGWDAPVVNVLVLATSVGSFMVTNQMRGRAIRMDPQQPQKIASIWHLAAVDPGTPSGLEDLSELARRFQTFVGVAADLPVIESGLERLNLPYFRRGQLLPQFLSLARNNEEMARRLEENGHLHRCWAEAVGDGERRRVLPSIRSFRPPELRPFHFQRTLGYFLAEAGFIFIAGVAQSIWGMKSVRPTTPRELFMFLAVAATGGAVLVLPRLLRAAAALVRHLPVDGSLRQIALALRGALCEAGLLSGDPALLRVQTTRLPDGSFIVALADGEFYERALFADCLQQVLAPIENPRYLLTRESRGWPKRIDFHAVPQVLATSKQRAELFQQHWLRFVGPSELIFTRNSQGRRRLLQARSRAFSTALTCRADRLDRWQ